MGDTTMLKDLISAVAIVAFMTAIAVIAMQVSM